MKPPPMILGACLLAPILGAFAGGTINTVPVTGTDDPVAAVPRHETASAGGAVLDAALPDHYPLVTPRGTIPVEELWIYGRWGRDYRAPGSHDTAWIGEPVIPAYEDSYDTPAYRAARDAAEAAFAAREADLAALPPLEPPPLQPVELAIHAEAQQPILVPAGPPPGVSFASE